MTLAGFARRKDFIGGVLVLLLGLGAATQSAHYDIGSLRRMGPGFFPLALGVILAALGVMILLTGRRASEEASAPYRPEWRGWACICASLVAFIVLGRYGGLAPATFATVFIAALGDRQNSLRQALVLALSMCLVCVVVFWWLLQVQLPLFGWG